MKKKSMLLTIILLLFSTLNFAQHFNKISENLQKSFTEKNKFTKYHVWVYFEDKGQITSKNYTDIEKQLPPNSLKRRKKTFKNSKSLATYYDIPVNESYLNNISNEKIEIKRISRWLNAVSITTDKENILNLSKKLFIKKIDLVKTGKTENNVNFSELKKFEFEPKSTKFLLNYGTSLGQVSQINVPIIHDMGINGTGVIICVLDAGFNNLEHQVFSNLTIINSWDFVNNDANVDDEADMGTGNHGTMTLSTIGGFYSGQLIGPAYGASYLLAKTENTDTETTQEESNWVAAMEWAEYQPGGGPDVTSTSLGYNFFDDGTGYSPEELDGNTAVITIGADIAASLGIVVVNAAGNSGPGAQTLGVPADGDSVLTAGSVYSDGTISDFSSCGPTADGRIKPDVMAQGSNVFVASPTGNEYTSADGTSFSCPLTAGAAALLVQLVPDATNMQIYEALRQTANNSSTPNNQYGWGVLNTYEAYQYLITPHYVFTQLNDTENTTGPYTVNVEISSLISLTAGSTKLYYKSGSSSWNSIIMTNVSGNIYSAEIPGLGVESDYSYYFTTANSQKTASLPVNAPTSFFSFHAGADNIFPVIQHQEIKEYYTKLWGNAYISTQITDNLGINTSSVIVNWTKNEIQMPDFILNNDGNNNFTNNFPQSSLTPGDVIKYKISASDISLSNNTTNIPSSGYFQFEATDMISFEQNSFVYDWIFSGNSDWTITNSQFYNGLYSSVSGNINDSETSSISLHYNSSVSSYISFFKKVSCENDASGTGYDNFSFSVNGVEKGIWDGEIEWSQETFTLNSGDNLLEWKYAKDGSVSSGSDCAWIDQIQFSMPVTVVKDNIISNELFSVFPNPVSDILNIKFSDNIKTKNIEIYSLTGENLTSYETKSNLFQFNFTKSAKGIYFVKVISGENISVKKVILK